jgi:hypothetical protein
MKKLLLFLLPVLFLCSGCGLLTQVGEMQQLSNCEFSLEGVEKVRLAGIHLKTGMNKSGLGIGESMTLTGALFNKNLPLQMNLIIKADNPNSRKASMTKMDFILELDNNEIVRGNVLEKYEIGPGASTLISIPIDVELFQALSGKTGESLVNLAFSLVTGKESGAKVTVKVKPYIRIGTKELASPTFISLHKRL